MLELFRGELLSFVSEDGKVAEFVDEFLEDFMKAVIRAIDRDPALIRKFLKDKRASEEPAEENKDSEEQKWDEKAMIPMIFARVQRRVPSKYFIYNTILDMIRQICIQADGKIFVQDKGSETLEAVYEAKKDLQLLFMQDQRIFFQVQPMS